MFVSPEKMAESIEMPFVWRLTRMDPRKHVFDGLMISQEEGPILRVVQQTEKHWGTCQCDFR